MHDFEIDDRSVTSGFVEAPGQTFAVAGPDIDPNRVRLDAGLGLSHHDLSAQLHYQGDFASDYEAHGLRASIGIRF